MRILKSGIEMSPQELRKLNGGYCACYCDGDYEGQGDCLATFPTDADTCFCSCDFIEDGRSGGFKTAAKYSSHPLP
jgi:hypothetical protein